MVQKVVNTLLYMSLSISKKTSGFVGLQLLLAVDPMTTNIALSLFIVVVVSGLCVLTQFYMKKQ